MSDLIPGGYNDPHAEGNSEKHRSGRACVDCGKPAGTAWSHLWCFECNVKRIDRISAGLKAISSRREWGDAG